MANEQQGMAELAEELWGNYIKQKVEEEESNKVSFFRASVVSNNDDGTLTVQEPIDYEKAINRTVELAGIEVGDEIVALKFGNDNTSENELVAMTFMSGNIAGAGVTASGDLEVHEFTSDGAYLAENDGLAGYRTAIVDANAMLHALLGGVYPLLPITDSVTRKVISSAAIETPISDITMTQASSIGGYAFASCSSLSRASFPECDIVGAYAFASCSNLTSVNLCACQNIGSNAFIRCYYMRELRLDRVSQVTVLGAYALSSTPIWGYTTSVGPGNYGSVYVPSSLYASFLTATNWVSISSRIVAV